MLNAEVVLRRQLRLAIVLSLALGSLATPLRARAGQVTPCGGSPTAPECAGTCPVGLRCVSLLTGALSMAGTGPGAANSTSPDTQSSGSSAAECGCVQVLCGGAPLADGQSCCNGVPFTLGTQGCCRGTVVAASDPCDCNGTYKTTAVGLVGSDPASINFPTENCCANSDVFASAGPASQTGCCVRDGLAVEYSLNSGYDCCPATGHDFCFGHCESYGCADEDCCTCTDCRSGPQPQTCKPPGSTLGFCSNAERCTSTFFSGSGPLDADVPCAVTCFQNGVVCFDSTPVANAICSDNGCEERRQAPAPAAESSGLLVLALGLAGVALLRLVRLARP